MVRRLPEVLLTPRQMGLLGRTKRVVELVAELSKFSKARGSAGDRVVNVQGSALANAMKMQLSDLASEAEVLAAKGRKGGVRQLPLKRKKLVPKKSRPYVARHGRIPLCTAVGVKKRPWKKVVVVRRGPPKK